MKARKSNNSKANRPLTGKVEKQIIERSDFADHNLSDYIQTFIEDCKTIGPMENFNLLSQEEAVKALDILAATQARIERQLKTAQALKRLLAERG